MPLNRGVHTNGRCPKCGNTRYWLMRNGKMRKCTDPKCKKEYRDSWGRTSLSREQFQSVASYFVMRGNLRVGAKPPEIKDQPCMRAVQAIREVIYQSLISISHHELANNNFEDRPFWIATLRYNNETTTVVMPHYMGKDTGRNRNVHRVAILPEEKKSAFEQYKNSANQKTDLIRESKNRFKLELFKNSEHPMWCNCKDDLHIKTPLEILEKSWFKGLSPHNFHLHIAEFAWRLKFIRKTFMYDSMMRNIQDLLENSRNPENKQDYNPKRKVVILPSRPWQITPYCRQYLPPQY